MTSHDERAAESREDMIQKLETEMMQWVMGEKSHWDYYRSCLHDRPADASVLCSIADVLEIQRYSLAIQALRSK